MKRISKTVILIIVSVVLSMIVSIPLAFLSCLHLFVGLETCNDWTMYYTYGAIAAIIPLVSYYWLNHKQVSRRLGPRTRPSTIARSTKPTATYILDRVTDVIRTIKDDSSDIGHPVPSALYKEQFYVVDIGKSQLQYVGRERMYQWLQQIWGDQQLIKKRNQSSMPQRVWAPVLGRRQYKARIILLRDSRCLDAEKTYPWLNITPYTAITIIDKYFELIEQ